MLRTLCSKKRVISSIKSAQKVNFKNLMPLKLLFYIVKCSPYFGVVLHVLQFPIIRIKVVFFNKILENQFFLMISAENLSIFVFEGQFLVNHAQKYIFWVRTCAHTIETLMGLLVGVK